MNISKRLALIGVTLFSVTQVCTAAFPTNTFTKSLTLSQLRADDSFKDFKAKMTGFEDLVLTFTYDQSIAGYYGIVKVKEVGGTNVYYVANTDDVTVSGSSLSFTVARTNSIPNGTHNMDIAIISSTSTNLARCGGQGKLSVRNSLFDDEDGTWQSPSFTNLTDYLTKAEAAGTYQATNANLDTLISPTAWRLFYSDGSSVVQELALESSGVLTANGTTNAPTWTAAGSGDITAVTVSGGILSGGTNTGSATITLTTNALNGAITNDYATGAEGDLASTAVQKAGDTMTGPITNLDIRASAYAGGYKSWRGGKNGTWGSGNPDGGEIRVYDANNGSGIGGDLGFVPGRKQAANTDGAMWVDGGLTVGSTTRAGDNNLRVEGAATILGAGSFGGNLNMGGNAITNAAYEIQTAPYALTSAATVTVSEAWTTNRFWLDMTTNVTLEVSNVNTNKAADWVLDVRMNSYTLTFGSTITNLTTAANFTRTNSYQSIVGNRPIYETITEVW